MSYFRPNITAMHGYVPGEQPRGEKTIKLNTNENPFPCSPKVKAAIGRVVQAGLQKYPDPTATAFRIASGDLYGFEPNWILCGNGSDELLTMLTRAFVDTGDMLELRDGRYYFVGRRGGIINVGGLKIHPEEVETVINRHPAVSMSLVKGRRNPVTGAIVVAELVLADPDQAAEAKGQVKADVLDLCRQALPPHKVPASIKIVETLAVTAGGKLERALA